jgi:hypothetical protein
MKKVQIDLKAIVKDLRSGKSDEEIRKKHNLSLKSLVRIKKALLERELITQEQLDKQGGKSQSKLNTINIKEFLKDFTEKSDDIFLMEKYDLSAGKLKQVYDKLIGKGLITEYEYHTRQNKTPELEDAEASPMAASTMIDLMENPATISRASSWRLSSAEIDLPDSFYKDHSIGGKGPQAKSGSGKSEDDTSTIIDLVGKEPCPNCGHPQDPHFSANTCPKCGVLYSKFKQRELKRKAEEREKARAKNDPTGEKESTGSFGSKLLGKIKGLGKKDPYEDW